MGMEPVSSLIEDYGAGVLHYFVGYLLAAVGRERVHKYCVIADMGQKLNIDLVTGKVP